MSYRSKFAATTATLSVLLAACSTDPTTSPLTPSNGPRLGLGVAGAGYTTGISDGGDPASAIGCLDNKKGVNCNNYASKTDVYMSGGPLTGRMTLENGVYYFAVLTPGEQNGGFVDGAKGNLSDNVQGGTDGDAGSGDEWRNRMFRVSTVGDVKVVTNLGTHIEGLNPAGNNVIQLATYDNTDNKGGVYILAICSVVGDKQAASPSQCKYDAFRIKEDVPPPPSGGGVVQGAKYYDANRNGIWDGNEAFIPQWPIQFGLTSGSSFETIYTTSLGEFTQTFGLSGKPAFGEYTFREVQSAVAGWTQTGNKSTPDPLQPPNLLIDGNQWSITGSGSGSSVTLNSDMTYRVTITADQQIQGIFFGNVCAPRLNGLTMGYWSNKNGQGEITAKNLFGGLNGLHLVNASGTKVTTFGSTGAYSRWLLSADASNMAYMLSAQMSATYLNWKSTRIANVIIDNAPAILSGFPAPRDVETEIAYAQALITAYPVATSANVSTAVRAEMDRVKSLFDAINNALPLVQPTLTDAIAVCGSPFPPS
jgi:hypothetical protein